MYAWRARIGLIKPTHRGKSFHFWYERAPDGVEIVPTFVGFRRSDRRPSRRASSAIEQIADDLKAVGCQFISLSGTPPVLLKGLDFEREWRDRLAQKIGLPVVSQMEPHALALVALGVKRVAHRHLLRHDELNNAIKRYFAPFRHRGRCDRRAERAGQVGIAVHDLADGARRSLAHAGLSILQGRLSRRSSRASTRSTSTAVAGMHRRRSTCWSAISAPRSCSRWRRKCGRPISGWRSIRRLAIAACYCVTTRPYHRRKAEPEHAWPHRKK